MADAAFARVYERHHQALYRYCRSILRHEQDAQDALQSTMMRAFVALQTERARSSCARGCSGSPTTRRSRSCAGAADGGRAGRDARRRRDARGPRRRPRDAAACCAATWPTCRSASAARWCCASSTGSATRRSRPCWARRPRAVKQAIFEARSALLRCREGRDTACEEIQRHAVGRRRPRPALPARARPPERLRRLPRVPRRAGRRPRELAALLPPLPGGAAAALLRGLFDSPAATVTAGGFAMGFAAKAAIVAAIAGGGGAVALHDHGRAAQDRAVAAPVTRAAEPQAPAGGILPVAAHAPARSSSPRRHVPATPPGRRDASPARARATAPPHRAKPQTAAAPGRAKPETATVPPGQAKKQAPRPCRPARRTSRPPRPSRPARRRSKPPRPCRPARRTSKPPRPSRPARRRNRPPRSFRPARRRSRRAGSHPGRRKRRQRPRPSRPDRPSRTRGLWAHRTLTATVTDRPRRSAPRCVVAGGGQRRARPAQTGGGPPCASRRPPSRSPLPPHWPRPARPARTSRSPGSARTRSPTPPASTRRRWSPTRSRTARPSWRRFRWPLLQRRRDRHRVRRAPATAARAGTRRVSCPGMTFSSGAASPFERVSDASVAYDAAHATWLISSIPLLPNASVPTVFVNRSTDDGRTWSTPVQIPPPVAQERRSRQELDGVRQRRRRARSAGIATPSSTTSATATAS